MADTARRLLGLWVRPTLFAALEERAHERHQDLDDAVRDILESIVLRADRRWQYDVAGNRWLDEDDGRRRGARVRKLGAR